MTRTAIGIDIGGTKISVVAGTESGKILSEKTIPTRTGAETGACLQDLVFSIEGVIERSKILRKSFLGIGVGIPGPVDSKRGIVPLSPHLKSWKGMPLARILSQKFQMPVILANDANAAGLGEKIFGQGRGIENFIYMTVSTGIGGGIVVNGQLLEGKSFVAGEVGHMTLVPQGALCKCGKQGCLEAYASGTAIARFAEEALKAKGLAKLRARLTQDGRPVTAQKLGALAREKNSFAIQIYEKAGGFLGIGIANLLNVLNPEKVILGGGVLKSAPPQFLKAMHEHCKREAWPEAYKAVKIVVSQLQGRVGDLGALALVFHRHC